MVKGIFLTEDEVNTLNNECYTARQLVGELITKYAEHDDSRLIEGLYNIRMYLQNIQGTIE